MYCKHCGKEIADDPTTTDDDLWFSVYDGGYVDLGSRLVSSGWAKEVNEDGDIYYHAPNHTQLVVKLKANENFNSLQKELTETEDKIQYARQFYNETVRMYNNARQGFPAVLIAGMLGFKDEKFLSKRTEPETTS